MEESGKCVYNKEEPLDNLITWVYERGSFAPTAKLTSKGNYSIISDYIGRAVQAYDASGKLVWSTDYDIYGDLTDLKGQRHFVPFRQAGQYEDSETGLYYNRFRYYDPVLGTYLSKDPIGLEGGNPNLYGYVFDSNTEVDVFGLSLLDDPSWLKKIQGPNMRRHDPTKISSGSVTKKTNTLILPKTDVVGDVNIIRQGNAIRSGDCFVVNNRVYGVHSETGRLFPISGDGFVTLDRGGFKALGMYNEFGNTPRVNEILEKMGVSADNRQKALGVWNACQ